MRKIEKEMNAAINAGKDWKKGNTEVQIWDHNNYNEIRVYLHGNCICRIDNKTGRRQYKNCGYSTMTTRIRLNALGANVRIKDYCMEYIETGAPVASYNFE